MESNQSQTQNCNQAAPPVTGDRPIDRLSQAEAIVSRNWKWASGAGLVPVPFVDLVSATAIQLKMLKELCDLYEVKFTKNLGKSAIGSLAGGLCSNLGTATLVSLAKGIPVLGLTVGILAQPVVFGATTYALGRVFIQHFETGGTLFTFDARALKEYFKQQFEAGKQVVEQTLANNPITGQSN